MGEPDLNLKLGLPNNESGNQARQEEPQGNAHQNFPNMDLLGHESQTNLAAAENEWVQNIERGGQSGLSLPEIAYHWPPSTLMRNVSDPLAQRDVKRCTLCGKTETPAWRKGPEGPKTLCNGCGLRYLRGLKKASSGKST